MSLLLAAALILAACASEDTQQKDETKQSETKYVATFTGHQPNSNRSAKSRTTATHTLGNPAQVIWEATDRIWVKADDGRFYQSEAADFAASATPADHSRANFHLSQGYYATTTPEVRYVGTSTNVDRVTIAATQTQASPNDFSHLGAAGDCGTATAHSGALEAGDYEFTLQHKASYLCFVPRCMNTQLGPNIKLTKIVVTADKPIAGTYDFSDGSLMGKTPTSGSNTITLNVGDANDFSLNTTTGNLSMNGAYMVVAPGTYNLTITYTMLDVNGLSLDFTKNETAFTCPEGQIRDLTANLTPIEEKYYMWDAKFDYWYNHLKPDGTFDEDYPQDNNDPRWYRENPNPAIAQPLDATQSAKDCPNANEMMWYAFNGDAHWVDAESRIIASNGHLKAVTIGGIWLKKKAKIIADEGITEAQMKNGWPKVNPHNYCTSNKPISSFIPSMSPVPNKTDYFFLPALGYYDYDNGDQPQLNEGNYWTSSADPSPSSGQNKAYHLVFEKNSISVGIDYRYNGMAARPFE